MAKDREPKLTGATWDFLFSLGAIAAIVGIFNLPTQWLQIQLQADWAEISQLLNQLHLLDWVKNFLGFDALSEMLLSWLSDVQHHHLVTYKPLVGNFRLVLAEYQVHAIWLLMIALVRALALVGAGVLFFPAFLGIGFLGIRARKIRQTGAGQSCTPFMQQVLLFMVWRVGLLVFITSLTPILSIQVSISLIVGWLGLTGFMVARVQKL